MLSVVAVSSAAASANQEVFLSAAMEQWRSCRHECEMVGHNNYCEQVCTLSYFNKILLFLSWKQIGPQYCLEKDHSFYCENCKIY